MIIRGNQKGIELQHNLQHIYDTIQKIVKNHQCYYTEEEVENLINDKNNIFIKSEQEVKNE